MKILQIATLISPDGAYGGPVRVAINQADALRAAGHDVQLVAAARGFGPCLPKEFSGSPVTLFPARTLLPGTGFAGIAAPSLWAWLTRVIRTADIVHVHLARDLVTLPAAAIARATGTPYVLQTHGMINESEHFLSKPLDRFLTKPVLRRARQIFYLTEREADDLVSVAGGDLRLKFLPNGVPGTEIQRQRNEHTEVLFLARLHAIKRPMHFIRMAERLIGRFPHARFTLVGPDEGSGDEVRDALMKADLGNNVRWEGPIGPSETLARMAKADVYVLPSVDETFPMAVLEAMSVGLPVVISSSCGLANHIRETRSGALFDGSLEGLVSAVEEFLGDPILREDTGHRASQAARKIFSMDAVVHELQENYTAPG
ncbi:hypothetical protein ASH00_11680 [Arthrobacter sp. Soil782]|uniref:glycosyltransferase n=1 Tax=Arthrobacter sp. Soil782 TaxID=1736410 RepID=UPI0006F1D8D8|nr:glycosyltransferase [Arthrobacter sp. Soil782]KRF05351.1 hypothetical protein ASH00_11680 [Arthrobacter sp. Soil782]